MTISNEIIPEAAYRRLQAVLYLLIRDEVQSGILHKIVKDISEHDEISYTNPFLAAEAYTLAEAILTNKSFIDILKEIPIDIIDQVMENIEKYNVT